MTQQNLQAVLEIGAEFPIRRDPDFQSVAHLIALAETSRKREEVRRLQQSFNSRTRGLDPKGEAYLREAEQLKRRIDAIGETNAREIREAWFKASRDYGYITRVRGRPQESALRNPKFWLQVKQLVTEDEWRQMWSLGSAKPATLERIREVLLEGGPEMEAPLLGTIDASRNKRRPEYDSPR